MDEELKKEFKKLNARATSLKMDLHDLAESLPTDWENIPDVSKKAFDAFKSLDEFKKQNSVQ